MTRRRSGAMVVLVVVALTVAWVAGWQTPRGAPSASLPSVDAHRLGPEAGQPVAEYLAALPSRLPSRADPPVPALVQFADELAPAAAVTAVAGAQPVRAVFRVPLPRVQTALRFEPLTGVDPAAGLARALEVAQSRAATAADRDAARRPGRPGLVAAAEARALRERLCRCVLAVLVLGDRAALTAIAGRPGVRAVDAAPVGTTPAGVALAPLLPEQREVAGPVPDDGPVPAGRGE